MSKKIKRLKIGSIIIWVLNVLLTVCFIVPSFDMKIIYYIPIIISSILIQYVLSLIESSLFDGSIPVPWKIDYYENPAGLWIWIGGCICLLLDIVINLGGVSQILQSVQYSVSSISLKDNLGISEGFISFIHHLFVILFSIVISVGSELIHSYIDILSGEKKINIVKKKEKDIDFSRDMIEIKRNIK